MTNEQIAKELGERGRWIVEDAVFVLDLIRYIGDTAHTLHEKYANEASPITTTFWGSIARDCRAAVHNANATVDACDRAMRD